MSALRTVSLDELLSRLPAHGDLAVVHDGARTLVGVAPSSVVTARGRAALEALDRLDGGWWAGFCAYDLGRAIERIPEKSPSDPAVPDLLLARFDARLRFDPDGGVAVDGRGSAVHQLERFLETSARPAEGRILGEWHSSLGRDEWERAVRRIAEHLRAGDCYQVNLTRRLSTDVRADPVSLFRALVRENPAPHAALVRIGDISVVSASPELFLRVDGRRIQTRPIKGTASDPVALSRSDKDRAENIMIVDLARNDIGRVCEYGTIRVPALCALERHPGLYHLVSTVTGTLRPNTSIGDVIRATFPPASVTGCPKPRVLEIIETLEPVRRGVYCGAVGFIDADARVIDLNVAIRTFTITPAGTFFGVGGGIVADSDAASEWDETELKARRLLTIAASRTA